MNQHSLDRFHDSATRVVEFPSSKELTDYYVSRKEFLTANKNDRILGVFDQLSGLLQLDGEKDKRGVYAHEFTHAVDQRSDNDGNSICISDNYRWQEAWKEEIEPGYLTKYATTDTAEGFAEYGRLVYQTPRDAKRSFPKCWQVWFEN